MTLGSITDPPSATARIAVTSCADVLDPLLQQVRTPGGAALEQRERVARLGVLAEHHDPDVRVGLTQPLGGTDALVETLRRHPNVGDDDVRALRRDRFEEAVEIGAHRDDLELGLRSEQPSEAFANEVVILREHDADPHRLCVGLRDSHT